MKAVVTETSLALDGQTGRNHFLTVPAVLLDLLTPPEVLISFAKGPCRTSCTTLQLQTGLSLPAL